MDNESKVKILNYMDEAFVEAKLAFDQGEVPIGAVLVHEEKIIARGHNRTEEAKNATEHAEMVCIRQASQYMEDFRLTSCELYTTLEPCIMCAGAAILSRLKKIVYACPDLRHGGCGSLVDLFAIKHPIHQVEVEFLDFQERSAKLLKDFFKARRK